MKLSDFSPHVQEQLRKQMLRDDLRAVERKNTELASVGTLDGAPKKQSVRKKRLGVVITLIAIRRRILDDDNNVASFKPLRDAIAKSLEVDDGDRRLKWQYGQQQTSGEQGVVVRVEIR